MSLIRIISNMQISSEDSGKINCKKLFVGGLGPQTSTSKYIVIKLMVMSIGSLKQYFEKFGPLEDCVIMVDRDNKTRGFGFVTFFSERALNDCMYIGKTHSIDQKIVSINQIINFVQVECKRAFPKQNHAKLLLKPGVKVMPHQINSDRLFQPSVSEVLTRQPEMVKETKSRQLTRPLEQKDYSNLTFKGQDKGKQVFVKESEPIMKPIMLDEIPLDKGIQDSFLQHQFNIDFRKPIQSCAFDFPSTLKVAGLTFPKNPNAV